MFSPVWPGSVSIGFVGHFWHVVDYLKVLFLLYLVIPKNFSFKLQSLLRLKSEKTENCDPTSRVCISSFGA